MTPAVTSTTTGQQARIGSLFSGYGGLDMGIMAALGGGSVAWHVEFDDPPSRILAHHWPDVPNYGDITTVDWSAIEPIDVLTGGFPCQDVSLAGARAGLKEGTRSGLWLEFAKAIDALRPQLVVIENVRGLLSAKTIEEVFDAPDSDSEFRAASVGEPVRGDRPVLNAFGRVLLDLAELGYVGEWCGVRAADAGAPHGRFRVFILAHPAGARRGWRENAGAGRGNATEDRRGRLESERGGLPDASSIGHEWAGRTRVGRAGLENGSDFAPDAERGGRDGRPRNEIGSALERAATTGRGAG